MNDKEMEKKLYQSKNEFFAKVEKELKASGSFEYQCGICDCPVKAKLTLTTMQVFVTPPPELKVEGICMTGLLKYSHKYNFSIP